MAINPLTIPSSQINNLVDSSEWSTLGNLGNVYREAQQAAAKRQALSSLTGDTPSDIQTLIRSGDPALAQLGLQLHEQELSGKREDTRLSIAQAAARRAQADWEKQGRDEAAAGKLISNFLPGGSPAPAAPSSPFPAVPPAAQGPAPSAVMPPSPQAAAGMPPVLARGDDETSAWEATPPLPAGLQPAPPPITPNAPGVPAVPLAPGGAPANALGTPAVPFGPLANLSPPPAAPPPAAPPPTAPAAAPPAAPPAAPLAAPPAAPTAPALPDWAADTVPHNIASRVATNLTSGQPPAAAGLGREQIAALYQNPVTRPLATVFLQNALNPGTWKVEKTEDGRVVAYNDKTLQSRDITPPTPTGEAPQTKQEREVQGYYEAGKKLGMSDPEAKAFAANKGKTPKEDLTPAEEKRVNSLTDEIRTAQRTLTNIAALKELSKSAWGFKGAGPLSEFVAPVPVLGTMSGATDTQDLINAAHSNVANVAKTIFPQRVTNTDLNLIKDLEGSANQPDAVRQRIWARGETAFQKIIDENTADVEAIRNKTFYKPGGGAPPPTTAAPPPPPAPPPAAKPTLSEFMVKARAANPGYTDGEIAREWKRRYGG